MLSCEYYELAVINDVLRGDQDEEKKTDMYCWNISRYQVYFQRILEITKFILPSELLQRSNNIHLYIFVHSVI